MKELRSLFKPVNATDLHMMFKNLKAKDPKRHENYVKKYVENSSRWKVKGLIEVDTIEEARELFELCSKLPCHLNIKNKIQDLEPLEGLINLERLYLGSNKIQDLEPLAGLTNLERLYLGNNKIQDLEPLEGLINLKFLYLGSNKIQDLEPLEGLINLEFLYLGSNKIQDLEPLAGLINLERLYLGKNKIQDLEPLAGLKAEVFI